MSKLNFLIFLNAYADKFPSNAPSRNNFKWDRELKSLPVENPIGYEFDLAPGETKSLFDGTRTLTQDGSTQYSIAPTPFSTSNYTLSWVGGTSPTFRTSRSSGADATTQVTVTVNGTVVTFTSTGGTNFNLISGGVVVGDYVIIGNLFNTLNQGEFQVISLNANSFSIVNPLGTPEGPITLGSGFASQIDLYSAAGVQVGDIVNIFGGFSLVTQGTYEITSVSDTFIQFATTAVLPTEGPITTDNLVIYSNAKRFVYLESDQQVTVTINGEFENVITPLVSAPCACPTNLGMLLLTSTVYSLSVTAGVNSAKLWLGTVE